MRLKTEQYTLDNKAVSPFAKFVIISRVVEKIYLITRVLKNKNNFYNEKISDWFDSKICKLND